jgi:PAS domain S-box-containing protein
MDFERYTALRGNSTPSLGEAAAALSAPGDSTGEALERIHDVDAHTLTLRADHEMLARENKILRQELAQRRLAATRFRRFFELPLIGISIASPERKMLEVNQKFCDMIGYTREELVGRDWATITHPDDVAANVRLLEQTLRGETEFYALDKRFIHRDGHLVYSRISVCCVRAQDGSVDHLVLTVQDMTPHYLALEQLERTEAHLKHGQQIAQIGSFEIAVPGLTGTRWSDELYHIVGLDTAQPAPGPEEYIERVVHADDRSHVRAAIMQRAQADHRVTLEYRIVRSNGAVRHVQSITDPVKDASGRIVKLVGTLIDVTERKLASEELEARTAQLDLLFQSAAEAIVLIDLDNRVLRANTEFTRLFGYAAEDAVGQDVNDLTVPAEMMGEAAELSARLAGGQLCNAESVRCRKDGSRLHVSILGAPITRSGQQIASYAIYRDITDRKRAEEAQARHGRYVALRADVHAALSRTGEPLRESLQRTSEAIVRHLDSVFARIWTLDETANVLELQASAGLHTHLDGAHSRIPIGHLEIGEIARDCAPRVCNEAFSEGRFSDPDWARRAGIITFAGRQPRGRRRCNVRASSARARYAGGVRVDRRHDCAGRRTPPRPRGVAPRGGRACARRAARTRACDARH